MRFFWCGLLFVGGFLWLLYGKHRLSRCAVIVLLAAFTLSGSWYYGYTKLVYDPVISYAGQETTFTGIVTHQTIFNNDKASYQVKGTFPDGTSATILCYTNDYGCNYGDILTLSGTMEIPSSNYLFDGTAYYKAKSIFSASKFRCNRNPYADRRLHAAPLHRTAAGTASEKDSPLRRNNGRQHHDCNAVRAKTAPQRPNQTGIFKKWHRACAFCFRISHGCSSNATGVSWQIPVDSLSTAAAHRRIDWVVCVADGIAHFHFACRADGLAGSERNNFLPQIQHGQRPCHCISGTGSSAALSDSGCLVSALGQRYVWCGRVRSLSHPSPASKDHLRTAWKTNSLDGTGFLLHAACQQLVLLGNLPAFSADQCLSHAVLLADFNLHGSDRSHGRCAGNLFCRNGNGLL